MQRLSYPFRRQAFYSAFLIELEGNTVSGEDAINGFTKVVLSFLLIKGQMIMPKKE